MPAMPSRPLPRANLAEVDALWKFDDPTASESAFRRALEAAPADEPDYVAQFWTQVARAQVLQRRYEDARETLDRTASLLSDATPVARIRHFLERGRLLNDTDRQPEAAALFERAMGLAVEFGCDVLAVDAAHMLGVMPPFDAAVRWNHEAIRIAIASTEPAARRWVGTLWMNTGVNHQKLSQYAEAGHAFQSALAEFESTGNAARARLARLCLSKNRRLSGDPGGALAANRLLLAEIRAAGEHEGYAMEEIAECLLALRRFDEAGPAFAAAYASLSTYPLFPPSERERLARLKTLAASPRG